MSYFAEIILPLPLAKTFTYSVSESEYDYLKPGMRVAVPFGKSKIYTGLVLALHQTKPELYEAKEIHQILDATPIVTENQLAHWQWIAQYYMCAIGEVYRSAIPSALILESETVISLQSENFVDESQLGDEEFLIYRALQQQNPLSVQDIVSILNRKNIFPVLRLMMEKNIIALQEEMAENYKPKLQRYVRLMPEFENQQGLSELIDILKNAQKQKDLVLMYFQIKASTKKPVSIKELTESSGASAAAVKALVDKGIFDEYQLQHDRVSFDDDAIAQPELSAPQQDAFNNIRHNFESKDVNLLHGVTSSGKTEIYIRLIDDFIADGKQVLYLVPEIALTAQLVGRLTRYFGNKVSVFHSKYSNNERVEVWNNVLSGAETAQVVIGARSALFLPFNKLGLIIVDEEHE
ncbi:MAG: DEAD/DEAH box helicase, partial [Flavobacterium sp.]